MEDKLRAFRESVYDCVHYAKDAFMDLVDALSSYDAKSVVELSLSPHFKRRHHSIPRALNDCTQGRDGSGTQGGLDFTNCLIKHSRYLDNNRCRFLALDETPQATPYSLKRPKNIIHHTTPTPGQKPICIGQSISVIGESQAHGSWFLPYNSQRIPSDESAVLFGLKQAEQISHLLNDKINITAADCKYSSAAAISHTWDWNNQVLLARLSPTRVFYYPHQYTSADIGKKGRPRTYGEAFRLRENQDVKADVETQFQHRTNQGKIWRVSAARFDGLLIKSKGEHNLKDKPVSIFRITVRDEKGERLYKEPLWLIGSGQATQSVSLEDIFQGFHLRFKIEHWFRFAKQRLLFNDFQTSDIEHADNWLNLPVLATHMLYHSRDLASACHRPWEKHSDLLSPTQVKRSMGSVLDKIGSPAKAPKLRGIGTGRKAGSRNQTVKETRPVQFKTERPSSSEKIVIKIGMTGSNGLGDVSIKGHNLSGSSLVLKNALQELINTGQASLQMVS